MALTIPGVTSAGTAALVVGKMSPVLKEKFAKRVSVRINQKIS